MTLLNRMVDHFGIKYEGRKPALERDLALLVIRWALPNATDEEVAAYAELRSTRKATEFETVVDESAIKLLTDAIGQDEGKDCVLDEVRKEVELQAQHAATRMPKIGVRKSVGPSALPRPSSASSAPALPPQGRQRLPAPIPIPDKDYTLAEARSFLPQPVPKGVHLAINKNAALEVKYNEKPSPP